MARRRVVVAQPDDVAVMPRHLVELAGMRSETYRQALREKREWFQAHGINPGDWPAVYAALRAARAAHSIEGSADRARRRFAKTGPTERHHP